VTPAELSQEVRAAFAYAARYVALLTENNPKGNVSAVLSRPDVDAVLTQALDQGRELAAEAVREAWGAGPRTEYLDWLLADVDRSYDSLSVLRTAVREAWHSVPPEDFQPGITQPGVNPAMEAARRRAEAVRSAVMAHASGVALRNRLSAEVAATAAQTAARIADGEEEELAGGKAWKQWRCRQSPPDDRTCHWCRALHGMVIPLHASFPAGEPADLTGHGHLTRPPRVYRGKLKGPPRHPRCRCRIVILTSLPDVLSERGSQEPTTNAGIGDAAPNTSAPVFLAAAQVREMPEGKFQALTHFLEAAVHELGQVLDRLRRLVSSQP
jgi:hypothetical protein